MTIASESLLANRRQVLQNGHGYRATSFGRQSNNWPRLIDRQERTKERKEKTERKKENTIRKVLPNRNGSIIAIAFGGHMCAQCTHSPSWIGIGSTTNGQELRYSGTGKHLSMSICESCTGQDQHLSACRNSRYILTIHFKTCTENHKVNAYIVFIKRIDGWNVVTVVQVAFPMCKTCTKNIPKMQISQKRFTCKWMESNVAITLILITNTCISAVCIRIGHLTLLQSEYLSW